MTDVTTPAALGMVGVLVAYLVSWLVRLLRFGRMPVDLEPLLTVKTRFLLSSLLVAHFGFAVGSFGLLIVVLVGLLAGFNVSRLVYSFVYVVLMMVFVRALFGVIRNAVIVLRNDKHGGAQTDI